MYQLRNLIHRTNVPSDPQKDMNAAEDFLLLLLHSHVTAAAQLLHSDNVGLSELANRIVGTFVRLPRVTSTQEINTSDDGVCIYATELLSLGLLWHGFHDAVKEGDGDRIIRCWKFLLVVFKSTSCHNYGKEAVNLLLQYNYTFSERQKEQLLWSRCINTRGYPGANIPCDLHMEHLNRRLKSAIHNMGANVKPKSIQKAGKALACLQHICHIFEHQTATSIHSDHHPVPKFGKDLQMILKLLEEENVFTPTLTRRHASFSFTFCLMEKLSRQDQVKKVETSVNQLHSL